MDDYLQVNRANWNARVPVHVGSAFYDVEGFKAGRNALRPFELDEVGEVAGRSLVHLQCHFGLDTLSWARAGAEVTGLDFSEAALLKQGGFLYVAEFHPFMDVLDDESGTKVTEDYFDRGPHVWEYPHTYTGPRDPGAPDHRAVPARSR